jgi:hypothetical protein
MKHRQLAAHGLWVGLAMLFLFWNRAARASEADTENQLRLLQQQNEALQNQLRQQQDLINSLSNSVSEIRNTTTQRNQEMDDLTGNGSTSGGGSGSKGGFNLGNVRISGEGSVGFLDSGSEGPYPNAEFRVDEARLFVDAQVWKSVYAFVNLNLFTPESSGANVQVGELYVDAEDLSQLWNQDGQLNARVGRFYIPFGEEYLTRYAIDNPLVLNSLSDLWGVDEGVELYGTVGKLAYVVAVQNGGVPATRDFTSDKSVAGRVSYDPNRWLHLSLSGMRTGTISVQNDVLSAMWFGNGFFRSLGSSNTTTFQTMLFEGDVDFRLPWGIVRTFGGYIQYWDNDPSTDNFRQVYYYSAEGVVNLTKKFYVVGQFSQIFAPNGFPIVADGNFAEYQFGTLTEEMWRLSIGIGYRFSPHFVAKTQYTIDQGKEVGGEDRNHENLFAAQLAFGF